ncbi:hypothetical protein BD311DRAFT_124528 [Dichomitus squalens]|uniref:CBF1-interacting co-repressor CIR N-terminal domain-containing protein n=1 Tax=Dichomitus squalens TaxID=114155 RepID=A0A4Q9M9D4_9APHY|nr:hypothetical protein BD311DRAFT_124528 [Dichomitus squalens]
MGKLNIAHHKSYHPYRRDNIERVRKDEEEAKQKEAIEEGRMMLADSEARMDLLRQRAGLQGSKARRDRKTDDIDLQIARAREQVGVDEATATAAGPSTLTSKSGHINLFEDLEQQNLMTIPIRSTRRPAPVKESEKETDRGVALAPSAKDLKPWYSDRNRDDGGDPDDDKRLRDLVRKSVHDPLTAINTRLASRDGPSSSTFPARATHSRYHAPEHSRDPRVGPSEPRSGGDGPGGGSTSAGAERTSRESAERLRALELIKRKKRELDGSETPSTVRGGYGFGSVGLGYGDVFNRAEVEEVQKARRGYRDNRGRERDRRH